MSHRISMEKARRFRERELMLQEMQQSGKSLPTSSRRQKKYIVARKRQEGFVQRLVDRLRVTGGRLPKHLKKEGYE